MALVRFVNVGLEVTVAGGTSILRAARKALAPEGSHCGGVCACTKCHVYIKAGADSLTPPLADEAELLRLSGVAVKDDSRLGCQAAIVGDDAVIDVVISEESFRQYVDSTSDDDRARVMPLWQGVHHQEFDDPP